MISETGLIEQFRYIGATPTADYICIVHPGWEELLRARLEPYRRFKRHRSAKARKRKTFQNFQRFG